MGQCRHQPILHSRGCTSLSPFLCVHVAFFFSLKQFDSIDFLNYIYFICHKGIGQPKVRGGESTTMLSKSNKLNFHVRNIEHWGSASRNTCVHKRIKLRYNFPNVTWSSCSVYITRPLHYDHTKRSPIPSSLSHSFPMSGKDTELNSLSVYANELIWMLNALQQQRSLLQCISSLHVYDPSLSDSDVQKHLLLFFSL